MAWNFLNNLSRKDYELLESWYESECSISDDEDDFEEECSKTEEEDEEVLKENVYKMQMQKFELFKSQNQETGHFDVTFVIDGKYLYANKYPLITSSETLNAWLSDRWNTSSNDPIKIETYSFNVFYQLCCFLYSGGCSLTKENIFQLIDAAEFFCLQLLKDYCETYLMQRRSKYVNENNLIEMMEFGDKYSLTKFSKYVNRCVIKNLEYMLEDEKFLQMEKRHFFRLFETKDLPFDALVKWTEHQVRQKKDESKNENFFFFFFDYEEEMKAEFSDFLPHICFEKEKFDVDWLQEFIAEKPFLLAPSNLVNMFPARDNRESELFETVYKLAETQALKKQQSSNNENFDLQKTIKDDLSKIIVVTTFSYMYVDFVIDFLVERSFLFSFKELLKILAECRRHGGNQEGKVFKAMYEVAVKEVLQKQEREPVKNFNLAEAVKAELAEFLPSINFYLMDKKFLKEFVVAKGILSYEKAFGNQTIKVEIESGGRSLVGIFEDKLEILNTIGRNKIYNYSFKEMKQRFTRIKFPLQKTPSELIKKDGFEWYLCIEWDGIIAVKHQSLIKDTDYIIAELKTSNGNEYFRLKTKCNTSLKLTCL